MGAAGNKKPKKMKHDKSMPSYEVNSTLDTTTALHPQKKKK